jgi:hypothetical protein
MGWEEGRERKGWEGKGRGMGGEGKGGDGKEREEERVGNGWEEGRKGRDGMVFYKNF